jgi:hypothetical protein
MKFKKTKISLLVLVLIFSTIGLYLLHPKFGIRFSAERLARIENSPNYKNGMFQNLSPSKPKVIKPNKGKIRGFIDFLNRDKTGLMPSGRVEIKKEDLHKINKDSNLVVWFGTPLCWCR